MLETQAPSLFEQIGGHDAVVAAVDAGARAAPDLVDLDVLVHLLPVQRHAHEPRVRRLLPRRVEARRAEDDVERLPLAGGT